MTLNSHDLIHGAVLRKLMHANGLTLLEAVDDTKCWYEVNTRYMLGIKTSSRRTRLSQNGHGWSYTFTIGAQEMQRLQEGEAAGLQPRVVLACVAPAGPFGVVAGICLLDQAELRTLLDRSCSAAQCVSLEHRKGCRFRVWGPRRPRREALLVPQGGFATAAWS